MKTIPTTCTVIFKQITTILSCLNHTILTISSVKSISLALKVLMKPLKNIYQPDLSPNRIICSEVCLKLEKSLHFMYTAIRV